jgi:flavorubredoxin
MKRYYADIVSHYASFVIKAGEKIRNLPIRILCTTHGPTYRRNPSYPISRYLDWSSNRDENKVVIVYGSMYEHTREAAEYLREALGGRGVAVKSFDLTAVHPGYVLPELIDAKAVLMGAPTYEGEIFPPVSNMIEYMKIKHIRPKPVAIFANYSWGSRITEALKMRLSEIGMKVIEPSLLVRGRMSEEDKQKADLMIENLTKELS